MPFTPNTAEYEAHRIAKAVEFLAQLIDVHGRLPVDANMAQADREAITGAGAAAKSLADVVATLQALIPPETSTSLPASELVCGSVTGRAYAHLPVTLVVNPTEGQVGSVGDGTHVDEFEFCDDPLTYEPTPGKIAVEIGDTAEETLANMLAAIDTVGVTYTQDGMNAVLISNEPGTGIALTASMPAGEGNVVGTNSYPIAPVPIVNESTPCKGVLIMAPCSVAGVPSNTSVAFIGNDTIQNIPIVQSNIEGVMIHIDDASKAFVKVCADGESVNYVIFQ